MADPRLAAPPKRARRQRATIVLVDESGLLLNPLVRRTLAPRGETPVLRCRAKHRQKVSLIAALTLSPVRHKLGFYFRSLPDAYFTAATVAAFLRHLLRHIKGKVIVVWDRWSGHRGPAIRTVLAHNPRLELVDLPAYAPELNPVEHLWTDLKWHRLANFAPDDVAALDRAVRPILRRATYDPPRLRTYWRGAKLHVPWALAS